MTRPYSEEFLLKLGQQPSGDNQPDLGIRLAKACVASRLPAAYVAKALDVSKLTIHHWFRGQSMRSTLREPVAKLITALESGLKSGSLPVRNIAEARIYLQNFSGREI